MKKSFTLFALAAVALSANAQQEKVWSTQEGIDAVFEGKAYDEEKKAYDIPAQCLFAQGEVGTFMNAFADYAKSMSISNDGVKSVIVDGVEYELTTGTTGSTNPQGIGIATPPNGGWVYQCDIKKDGYLTLFSKLSSNKSYYVFEGDDVTGVLQTYTLRMYVDLGDGSKVYEYTLPGDDDMGYFNMDLPDADRYSDGTSLLWPETILRDLKANPAKEDPEFVGKNGFGCITFPVYADAATYLFCAQGSKANTNGFIYTESAPKQVVGVVPEKTNADTGEVTPASQIVFVGEGGNGVNGVAVDNVDVDAPVYNVMGQRVSKNAKGLLIQNGRKFYNF